MRPSGNLTKNLPPVHQALNTYRESMTRTSFSSWSMRLWNSSLNSIWPLSVLVSLWSSFSTCTTRMTPPTLRWRRELPKWEVKAWRQRLPASTSWTTRHKLLTTLSSLYSPMDSLKCALRQPYCRSITWPCTTRSLWPKISSRRPILETSFPFNMSIIRFSTIEHLHRLVWPSSD